MTTPTYRPDIDGLRAIAVLAVLLFHSGFDVVSGGYVGVDVFFVISGFLITTIIVRELAEGSFSIVGFYERRMRRILPASIVTVAVCLIVGFLVFETEDLGRLARSAIANSFFLSNIYFYLQTGYFDAAAELKPLLHTWSLSLEEQYYVVTPLLLMLIARFFSQRHMVFIAPIAIASFAACVYGTTVNPSGTFYMLWTRAWELLIGSILAIAAATNVTRISNARVLQGLAILGLGMILFSIFAFDNQTAFPGAYAAIPTVGTAMLIYTGQSGMTPINRLLAVRPMVFVGLISYSLYLWHWPIIVFTRYLKGVELTHLEISIMLLATFAISILSWRFVETPFRRKRLLPTRKGIFIGSIGSTLALVVVSLFGVGGVVDIEWRRWRACENVIERLEDDTGLCVVGDGVDAPSFILWGDSHARAFNSAVHASGQRLGLSGYVASKPGCAPLRGIERDSRPDCSEFNETMLSYIGDNPGIETVILAANWTGVVEVARYMDEGGERAQLQDTLASAGDPPQSPAELMATGLTRTIQVLQELGRRVIIVGPVPEIGHNVPSVSHIARRTNRDVNDMIAPTIEEYESRSAQSVSILSTIAEQFDVPAIWPSEILCNERRCVVALDDGVPLYHDDDHLSTAGAQYVSEILDPVLSD